MKVRRGTLIAPLLLAVALLCGARAVADPIAAVAATSRSTLAPATALPSGAACAAAVERNSWEPRPENAAANTTPGMSGVMIDGASVAFNAHYAGRIDGAFTGTTDELIQWAACKWGFDSDAVRAVAVQESFWRQGGVGDFDGREYLSYGLLQVKKSVHTGTFPTAKDSTAFNLDYALAWRRACYEGDFTWFNDAPQRGGYRAGDEWGCIGAWFSGDWYDAGAQDYIAGVRDHYQSRTWEMPGF